MVSQDFTFSPGTDTLSDTVLIIENIDVLQMTETFQLLLSTTDLQVTTGSPATVNIEDTGNCPSNLKHILLYIANAFWLRYI